MKKILILLVLAFFTAQFVDAQEPPANLKHYLDRNYPQWQTDADTKCRQLCCSNGRA